MCSSQWRKDSITQVSHLLNKKLRILAINIDYGIKTDIGHKNYALVKWVQT